jgi:hypothetical protein
MNGLVATTLSTDEFNDTTIDHLSQRLLSERRTYRRSSAAYGRRGGSTRIDGFTLSAAASANVPIRGAGEDAVQPIGCAKRGGVASRPGVRE